MPLAPTKALGEGGDALPRALGNVDLIRLVSRDARGEAYIGARTEGVEPLCLVYVPAKSRLARTNVLDDLKAEAGWLVRRVHGNLVQIYDVGEDDGQIYFASELVEGRDLRTLRERVVAESYPVAAQIWVHIAIEIASAIEFVRGHEEKATDIATHLAGLSPSSVLLGVDGSVKLSHLGSCLALPTAELVDPDALSLVAPECLKGAPWSARADVFVVGSLLWRCLSGRTLIEDPVAHIGRVRTKTWKPPALVEEGAVVIGPASAAESVEEGAVTAGSGPVGKSADRSTPVSHPAARSAERRAIGAGVDPELEALVLAALDPDPERRPEDVAALRARLTAFNKAHATIEGTLAVRTLVTDLFGKELALEAANLTALSVRIENAARGGAGNTLITFQTNRRRTPIHTDDDLPIGETIPGTRYKVLAKLGEGGMGTVYAAEHVDIERQVALKLLHAELLRNPNVLQQFRQEARATSKIGNPYICDVTDWGEVPDGRVFFVMEYVEGASLGKAIRKARRMPPERMIPIVRQAAKALAAVHDKGIVHLDMKPDNLLLHERDGRADAVKVVDFGIAGLMGQGGIEGKVMGTPEYMAPERIAGKAADRSCDIYSLGVLAYEMLSGEAPFTAQTPVETLAMHSLDAPAPFREKLVDPVPAGIEAVIFRMLEKDPGKRPATMQEVEICLVEAQIAAGLRTPWDDHLSLPTMDAVRYEEIRRGFRRIATSRWRHANLVLTAMTAIAVLMTSIVLIRGRDTVAVETNVRLSEAQSAGVAASRPSGTTISQAAPAGGETPSGAGVGQGAPADRVAPAAPAAAAVPAAGSASRPTPVAASGASRSSNPPPVAVREGKATHDGGDALRGGKFAGARSAVTGGSVPPAGDPVETRPPAEPSKDVKESAERGIAALQSGRVTVAEREFKSALAIDGSYGPALGGLAEVAFEDARYEDAANLAKRALKIDPRRTRYAVMLGDAYYKLGRLDEALVVYERAMALEPSDATLKARVDRVKARVKK